MKSEMNNHSLNILIAEDSRTQADLLGFLLKQHGYRVTIAANGKQALETAQAQKPTLIISDVMMPEMNGYELCKAIKSDENLKDIPVILVTTLSDAQDVIRGLECGADNFIRKPYDERYLLSRINYLLMNLDMRKEHKMQVGVEINLGGQKYFINSERQQILDLLISTYEQAIHINNELKLRETELEYSNRVLNGLYEITAGINHAITEREVAESALEQALELPGIQAGWILMREGESGFRTAATRNLPPALMAPGALDGDCACLNRLLSGKLNSVSNILECERLAKAKGDTHGLRYHASVPLRVGDRVMGVMNLTGAEPGLFDEAELKVLQSVGNQVAVAMERASLHEHLERLVEERTAALTMEIDERKRAEVRVIRLNRIYSVLSGINTTIVRVREEDELFKEACRIAVEQGGFIFAWIGKLDADSQQVTPVAQAGRDDGYLAQINLTSHEDMPGNCVLTAQALTEAKPVICNDIASDERMAAWSSEALSRGYRSVVVLPLILEGKLVGVFVLYAAETGIFDEEEMRLLIEIAGDISFAMNNLKKEEKLNYLAYYDVITSLPNRALFYDRLDQHLHDAQSGEMIAVLAIDLERFRNINETFGRRAGDALLKQVAEHLITMEVGTDHLARINADCFALVLTNIREVADVVRFLGSQIATALSKPFMLEGQELRISVRTGIAIFPDDGKDADTLFRNAEAALKKAKLSSDKYLFYTPALNARAAEKLTLENKLRRALEQEQLVLHYQPKVDLKSGQICGLEALMRWNDPETGLMPPWKFIPLFEETGMIVEAGAWALARAIADYRDLQKKNLSPPRIAVNVSQVQLQRNDFVSMVERVMSSSAEMSSKLEIELTESLVMQDVEANILKLHAIREMGVEVAIDDFGTGYSSLSYIAKLPINSLKIDRAFIINMTSKTDDMSIVSAIISLAHSLHLRVVAEGVETNEQANLLRLLKCDEIQGFLFSPAVPITQIEEFLRDKKSL